MLHKSRFTSLPSPLLTNNNWRSKLIGFAGHASSLLCLGFGLSMPAEGGVLFQDEFDGDLSTKWEIYAGSAYAENGWAYLVGGPPLRGAFAFTKEEISTNRFTISTRLVTEDGGADNWFGGALYFNVKKPIRDSLPETYYALALYTPKWGLGGSYETNSLYLIKSLDGVGQDFFCGWHPGAPAGLLADNDNEVEISVTGGHFEVTVNGKFAFACDDPDPIVGGKVGLTAIFESVDRYDFVRVVGEGAQANFKTFTPRAEFTLGPKTNDDSYWVRGWLKLADTSNGINPLTEAVTIKVGPFSHTLPAGSFSREGDSYMFKGPVGASVLDVRITGSSTSGGYSFKSCLKKGDLEATTLKPDVQLTIGDDSGQATLDVGYAKFGKGSNGKSWVFPPAE